MTDVSGKFFSAKKVRTGVSPSSPGVEVGETLPPVNPPGGGLNSVGLTMPTAFNVANSPLTSNGTIAVTGAGTVAQYVRGDGSLADFPSTTGGGSSVSYYLNGSVNQGTFGGVTYYEVNRTPVLGAGTDFTISGDGYIASFITDAMDPNQLVIPSGNWNFETYFQASSSGGTPTFYVELYKVSGTTFTLIASNSGSPEFIAFGTTTTAYFSTLAVPQTTLALTDRLAIRYYVTHSGRTITMHTENNTLCQVITTFTTGLTALNGLTNQVQFFAVGTSGSDFNIASATDTHTFNLPTASSSNRGALSSADWALFTQAYNDKINSASVTGTTTKTLTLTQQDGGTITASWTDLNTDAVISVFGRTGAVVAANGDYTTAQVTESGNLYFTNARSRQAISLTTSGTSGAATYDNSTGVFNIPNYGSALSGYLPLTGGTLTGPLGGTSATFSGNVTTETNFRGRFYQIFEASGARGGLYPYNLIGGGTDYSVGLFSTTSLFFSTGDVGDKKMVITAAGRVLIGNPPPTESTFQLDVNGTGRFSSNLTANSFIKNGGTSTQFLKADGSIDSNTYVTGGPYLALSGGIMTGVITTPNGTFGIIVGDDSRLADRNIANTLFLEGVQNPDRGYINFGDGTGNALGAIFNGDLTWKGNVVWHAGNITPVTTNTTQTITGQKTISRAAALFSGTIQSFLIDGAAGDGSLTINSASGLYSYQQFAQAGVSKFEIGIVGTSNNGSFYINRNVQSGEAGSSIYIKKADGFVGINNNNPTFQFDVNGTGRFSGDLSANNLSGTNTGNVTIGTANGLSLIGQDLSLGLASGSSNGALSSTDWTTFNNKVSTQWITSGSNIYYNSGNVGIGTASPTTFSGNTVLAINNSAGGAVLELQSNGTSALRMATSSGDSALWEPRNVPVLFATNNLERFTIHQNGNLVFKGQSTTAFAEGLFQNTNSALNFFATNTTSFSKDIGFFTNTTTGQERMRITSGGNVLIGTTTSNGAIFQVTGNTYLSADLRFGTNFAGSNTAIIKWQGSGAAIPNSLGLFTWADAKDIQIGGNDVYFGAEGATPRMRITSGGNVLIGTTTDNSHKLRVAGDTNIGGRLGVNTTTASGSVLIINGENNGSADNGLLIRNSSSTNLFRVRNDGVVDTIGNPVASNLGSISINGTYQTIFTAATDAAYFLTVQTSQSDGTYAIFTLYNENSGERFTSTILGNNIQVQFSGNAVQIRSANAVSYLTTWSAIRIK